MSNALRCATRLLAAVAILGGSVAAAQPAPPQEMNVTLLGTAGGPGGHADRSGIATLVTVGSRRYLVDAGLGVARQLARSGVSEAAVPVVFLTHLHDDHTAGLPGLMTFAWTLRSPKMELVGPPGTRRYFDAAMALLHVNADIRMAESRRFAPPEKIFSAREMAPGVIYSDEAVRVTAIENTHYQRTAGAAPAGSKSYALKFEGGGRTIVLTGDTGPSAQLLEFAQGADVLVSEMVTRADIASVPPFVREHMLQEHLDAAEVGKLAAKARVKTLVLSHVRELSAADADEIKQYFPGTVVMGTDLARF